MESPSNETAPATCFKDSNAEHFSQESSQESEDYDTGENAQCATDTGFSRFSVERRLEEAEKDKLYCGTCDDFFLRFQLEKHFIKHITQEFCQYCSKGVYRYRKMGSDVDIIYHKKCNSEELPGVPSVDANQNS